jgi:hypothetical protein
MSEVRKKGGNFGSRISGTSIYFDRLSTSAQYRFRNADFGMITSTEISLGGGVGLVCQIEHYLQALATCSASLLPQVGRR